MDKFDEKVIGYDSIKETLRQKQMFLNGRRLIKKKGCPCQGDF